jgi:hypothetical protein
MAKVVQLHRADSFTMPLAEGTMLQVTPFRESRRVAITLFGPAGGHAGGVVLRADRAHMLASWVDRAADECGRPTRRRSRARSPQRGVRGRSGIVAAPPELDGPLTRLAQLAVTFFADWCSIDVLREDGRLRRLPVAHADPSKAWIARRLQSYPPDVAGMHPRLAVLLTGQPDVVPEISDTLLAAAARDGQHLELLRSLGYRSSLTVPLRVGPRAFGVATFVTAESGRRYDRADLPVAEGLARLAALVAAAAVRPVSPRRQPQTASRTKRGSV